MSAADLAPSRASHWCHNYWAIAAGVTLAGYALVGVAVLLLWVLVRFFVPGISDPHPSLAERLPGIMVGLTCVVSIVTCFAAAGLSLMGLVQKGPHRTPAIVTLVVSMLCLIPACWLAVFGGVLLLLSS